MEQRNHPEELEPTAAEAEVNTQEQTQEDTERNRRSFLKRAAVGVAGAAGLVALGAQTGQAAASGNAAAKSKILERIRLQLAQQSDVPLSVPGDDPGGGEAGVYMKNSHGLYLK